QAMILFAMLAGVGFAVGFGIWMSRRISRPVKDIAQRVEQLRSECITNLGLAMAAMASGDLSCVVQTVIQPVTYDSKDEIGALGRSVNGIIRQSQETVASFVEARGILQALIEEMNALSRAAEAGLLDQRGHADKFHG